MTLYIYIYTYIYNSVSQHIYIYIYIYIYTVDEFLWVTLKLTWIYPSEDELITEAHIKESTCCFSVPCFLQADVLFRSFNIIESLTIVTIVSLFIFVYWSTISWREHHGDHWCIMKILDSQDKTSCGLDWIRYTTITDNQDNPGTPRQRGRWHFALKTTNYLN